MKTYSVTVTFAFSLEAPNKETAQKRAEAFVEAMMPGPAPKRNPKWWSEIADPPEVEVTEDMD